MNYFITAITERISAVITGLAIAIIGIVSPKTAWALLKHVE
jgi:hypothetical protein